VTGRKKNLIILSNGENVSPEEIEAALARDEGVAEVAVYEYGNKIVASIYPNDAYFGDGEYFDDIIYKYNKDKARNRQIAMVRLRSDPMPRNNNGKILRNKLIEEDNNEE
jgi:long-chain acyl-CoA synthetase